MVSLKDEATKSEIMSNLKNFRHADPSSCRFKGISIAHDLTPKQRDEVKRVLEEAKAQQAG